jgi:glycosyltransferase involved in cell wall biosynthesis
MKKISIIIPVFNEQNTVAQVVAQVKSANTLGLEKQIVVVDDASTDSTSKILNKLTGITVFRHPNNLGKTVAVKTGFQKATGDIILIQDADLEYSPENYPDLLRPLLENKADVVYGSRLLTSKPHRVLFFWHFLANQVLTSLSNVFSNLNLTDMETGYKVFTRQIGKLVLPRLTSSGFGLEPEITAYLGKLARKNLCRVYEVGISYHGRTYAEGKKIKASDAFHAVWCIVKFNLLPLKFDHLTDRIKS